MNTFDMLNPIACDLEARRRAGEAEEAKHDCPLQERKAVIIPENPTNGDVIKALFPDNPIDIFIHDVNIREGINVIAQFDREWWDAPKHKAEREQK